uniref:NADH-ubiquinone oxidoreductase chain 2 n=1 Tax=Chromodoris orientalis TaxID=499925 RepID=A0A411GYJ3_9GAST|nr:NADH dehydrogenase subunit 2 [Chromodoris orientalis]QBB11036.1 NADH dehydrogenase subunit 2 [Chromodoris orientalis]
MSSGNLLFLVFLLLGPFVSISSSSWVMCWVGLEMSFLGLIPLLLNDSSYMSLSKESAIKYFCIQALGSGLLMLGGVMYYMNLSSSWFWDLLFMISLLMKLGVFPMHFWVPSVIAGLDWEPILLMLTWQKIAPFAFLVNVVENNSWLVTLVLVLGGLSTLVGAMIGLNQTSVRAMLGGSSIAHAGWSCLGVVFGGLWVYFLIYCLSFMLLMMFFSLGEEMMVSFGILGLSGLPPFIMFIGKWTILKNFLYGDYTWMFLVLPLFSTLLSLSFYLKFFYSYYMSSAIKNSMGKYFDVCAFIMFVLSGVLYLFFV